MNASHASPRPDVDGIPVNYQRPLSQQNKINGGVGVQNQEFLQHTLPRANIIGEATNTRTPLAQMNSKQNVSHVTARPDINLDREPIVNSVFDRQHTNVAPQQQQKTKKVFVATPQDSFRSSVFPDTFVPTFNNFPQQQAQTGFQPPKFKASKGTYPVRPQGNSAQGNSSIFGLFMALVGICVAVAIAIFSIKNRR